MDGFEWNKIIGAILGTMLFVLAIGFIAEAIYRPIEGRGVGYALPEVAVEGDGPENGGGDVVVAEVSPLAGLLAAANVDAGQRQSRKCFACHNFEEGAANKVGPRLWDIVGRPVASEDDFNYSEAMQEYGASGAHWTYDELDQYLTSPKALVAGTKMSFAGMSKPEERADLLAFLRTLSATPVPFPDPQATAAGEAAPVAEGESPGAAAELEAPPVAEPEAPPAEPVAAAVAPVADGLAASVAAASTDAGERVSRKCAACHDFREGGVKRVGPPLWGIVGRAVAAEGDFAYSPAMAAFGATGAAWTIEILDAYLANPKALVPGTKMTFPGIADEQERIELLAYLQTLGGSPPAAE
ncbi:MAG: cytochrome c family protein [Cucumibacter sp.]